MKDRISFQIALAVGILALCAAAAVSVLSYFVTYSNALVDAQRTLLQLGQTVQSTASVAAYMNDAELAREVVQGLEKNEIVGAASLTSTRGLAVSGAVSPGALSAEEVKLKLISPFTPGEAVGELRITMKQSLINLQASAAAWTNAMMLGGYTLFGALVVFMVIQWRLISGIKLIAARLNHIVPGRADRLGYPAGHHRDEVGRLVDDINKLLDLSQRKLDSERALLSQVENLEKRFRMIYERAAVGIFLMDSRGRLVMANPAFREIIGEALFAQVDGQDVNCMITLFSDSDATLDLLDETYVHGQLSADDLPVVSVGETQHWVHCLLTQIRDEAGATPGSTVMVQGIISDISARKLEEQKIRFHAERDPLTGLLNRRSAEQCLQLMIEKARYEGSHVAVCLIDLDNFKPINDSYGHDAGDQVLVETARRMRSVVRSSDMVARLGGDEFLLAIQGVAECRNIETVLQKLLAELTTEINLGKGVTVQVGASIGVAKYPEQGAHQDELITRADKAMYEVKRRGKNGFQVYGGEE